MFEKNINQIFYVFRLKLYEKSKAYGLGQAYIQGQLEEACHQLKLQNKKMYKELPHGF